MAKTEQEMKQTWCPHARACGETMEDAAGANRTFHGDMEPSCKCLGSACSQWVWIDYAPVFVSEPLDPEEIEGNEAAKRELLALGYTPGPTRPAFTQWKPPKEPLGDCGLKRLR